MYVKTNRDTSIFGVFYKKGKTHDVVDGVGRMLLKNGFTEVIKNGTD